MRTLLRGGCDVHTRTGTVDTAAAAGTDGSIPRSICEKGRKVTHMRHPRRQGKTDRNHTEMHIQTYIHTHTIRQGEKHIYTQTHITRHCKSVLKQTMFENCYNHVLCVGM